MSLFLYYVTVPSGSIGLTTLIFITVFVALAECHPWKAAGSSPQTPIYIQLLFVIVLHMNIPIALVIISYRSGLPTLYF